MKLSLIKKNRLAHATDDLRANIEKDFLKDAYYLIENLVSVSKEETTLYSPSIVSSGQKFRGSSIETSSQRSKYVCLGTKGVSGQVFNMSFKNCGKDAASSIDQVLEASNTVIEYLLSNGKFRNEYSAVLFRAMKDRWKHDPSDAFSVSGGLLFPILTLLLISFNSPQGIVACFESYGGKKRGHHYYWEFQKTSTDDINETIKGLKNTEKDKIPFCMKKAFQTIKNKWPSMISSISLIWGIGCDALGSNITKDDPSFLVCQPVTIDEVNSTREGKTSRVFENQLGDANSFDLSAITRNAAQTTKNTSLDSDSDSDSDSNSNKNPIRLRYFFFLSFFLCLFVYLFLFFLLFHLFYLFLQMVLCCATQIP